jgi:predicted transcriptional regulator
MKHAAARTSKVLSVSLPPEMLEELDRVRKAEHRTRSELVREAFRLYFVRRYGEVKPTRRELRALERGRAEIARGEYVTLDQLHRALAAPRRTTRRKKSPAPRS